MPVLTVNSPVGTTRKVGYPSALSDFGKGFYCVPGLSPKIIWGHFFEIEKGLSDDFPAEKANPGGRTPVPPCQLLSVRKFFNFSERQL